MDSVRLRVPKPRIEIDREGGPQAQQTTRA